MRLKNLRNEIDDVRIEIGNFRKLEYLYERCDVLTMTPFKNAKTIEDWYNAYRKEFDDFMKNYFTSYFK